MEMCRTRNPIRDTQNVSWNLHCVGDGSTALHPLWELGRSSSWPLTWRLVIWNGSLTGWTLSRTLFSGLWRFWNLMGNQLTFQSSDKSRKVFTESFANRRWRAFAWNCCPSLLTLEMFPGIIIVQGFCRARTACCKHCGGIGIYLVPFSACWLSQILLVVVVNDEESQGGEEYAFCRLHWKRV